MLSVSLSDHWPFPAECTRGTATCIQRVLKSFQVIKSSNKMEKCSVLKLFLIWLSPHLCISHKRRDTCSVCCSFPTIAVGQAGFANSPCTLSGLFPPTSVCSLLPASLSATISLLLLYIFFYSHYLCLSLSFLFSVTFHLPAPVIILPTCLDWRDNLCFQHVRYLCVAVPGLTPTLWVCM